MQWKSDSLDPHLFCWSWHLENLVTIGNFNNVSLKWFWRIGIRCTETVMNIHAPQELDIPGYTHLISHLGFSNSTNHKNYQQVLYPHLPLKYDVQYIHMISCELYKRGIHLTQSTFALLHRIPASAPAPRGVISNTSPSTCWTRGWDEVAH